MEKDYIVSTSPVPAQMPETKATTTATIVVETKQPTSDLKSPIFISCLIAFSIIGAALIIKRKNPRAK